MHTCLTVVVRTYCSLIPLIQLKRSVQWLRLSFRVRVRVGVKNFIMIDTPGAS